MIRNIVFACCLTVAVTTLSWATHPNHDMGDQRELELALQHARSDHARLVDDLAELNLMNNACERTDEFNGLQESAWVMDVRYSALLRPGAQHEPLRVLVENRLDEGELAVEQDCNATLLEQNAQSIRNTLTRFERAISALEVYVSRSQSQSQPY
ncbi:MAG: hypothetical protein DHS20C06_03740 [Hyphobacterium sp.]|nr:MAG: hypothetical protein DHS20C06_03740 [Hyphobacterium sp.]